MLHFPRDLLIFYTPFNPQGDYKNATNAITSSNIEDRRRSLGAKAHFFYPLHLILRGAHSPGSDFPTGVEFAREACVCVCVRRREAARNG
jgi:hypothetical protein